VAERFHISTAFAATQQRTNSYRHDVEQLMAATAFKAWVGQSGKVCFSGRNRFRRDSFRGHRCFFFQKKQSCLNYSLSLA